MFLRGAVRHSAPLQAGEEEEDMLDLATGATRTSRLACQIILTDAMDGLTVRIPPESRNMQGR